MWADAVILQFPLWWFRCRRSSKAGGAGLRLWFRLWRGGTLRRALGRPLWGRHAGRQASDVGRDRRRLGVSLQPERHQRSDRRSAIPDPARRVVLPRFDVLPPFMIYRTGRMDDARFSATCDALGQRLDDLWTTQPIAFRPQNSGAYEIPQLTLRDEIAADEFGFAAHIGESAWG